MPSKTRQDVLRFSVRKTRSSSRSKCAHFKENSLSPKKKNLSPQKKNLLSPQKTKLISEIASSKESITTTPSKLEKRDASTTRVLQTLNIESPSRRSPRKLDFQNSPSKLESPAKRTPLKLNVPNNLILNLDSPVRKSPRKLYFQNSPSRLESPAKRTPQKLEIHNSILNLESPVRRSPRKLEFQNSPSTLISQLSVSLSKSPTTNIGVHRSEFKAYQSLKTSFSRNFNNRIVGRETEIKFLTDFLLKHLKGSIAGSLYISGAPGTGKTASVTNIADNLTDISFKKVVLNCMSKKSSKDIFTSIAESLRLNVANSEREIVRQIEKALTTSKVPIILILDEVDQLESKDQKILYTLFEWPSLSKSKLILVGIANMLDLTDRILPRLQANQSCRPQLLHFPPYSKSEIVQIINERIKEADLGDVQVIKASAIHFLAGKVSAVAGDVRRALDVCRRAIELCEIQARNQRRLIALKSPSKSPRKGSSPALKQVDIPQILAIFNEIYGSKVTSQITENPNTFPLQQKVLICSLLLILKHAKGMNVNLGKFHEVYSRVCQRQKLPGVEQSEFFSLCTLLESRGMLQVKKAKEIRNSKIFLRLNAEEAESALGDKVLLATILEDKASLGKSKS